MMAGGLHGIENELELEPPLEGNAYDSDAPKVPHTMPEAREAFTNSAVARAALGDEVVDHYTNMADVELADYDATVTDWELRRGYERM
jgi:glutamine synthetase